MAAVVALLRKCDGLSCRLCCDGLLIPLVGFSELLYLAFASPLSKLPLYGWSVLGWSKPLLTCRLWLASGLYSL